MCHIKCIGKREGGWKTEFSECGTQRRRISCVPAFIKKIRLLLLDVNDNLFQKRREFIFQKIRKANIFHHHYYQVSSCRDSNEEQQRKVLKLLIDPIRNSRKITNFQLKCFLLRKFDKVLTRPSFVLVSFCLLSVPCLSMCDVDSLK